MVPNILQCTRQHSTIKIYPAIKTKMSVVHRLRNSALEIKLLTATDSSFWKTVEIILTHHDNGYRLRVL